MKTYAHARIIGSITGTEIEACGSDAVFGLDSRLNLSTQKEKAHAHFTRLNDALDKGFVGFNIYRKGAFVVGQSIH